MITTR